jgi:hypothetical protein
VRAQASDPANSWVDRYMNVIGVPFCFLST